MIKNDFTKLEKILLSSLGVIMMVVIMGFGRRIVSSFGSEVAGTYAISVSSTAWTAINTISTSNLRRDEGWFNNDASDTVYLSTSSTPSDVSSAWPVLPKNYAFDTPEPYLGVWYGRTGGSEGTADLRRVDKSGKRN